MAPFANPNVPTMRHAETSKRTITKKMLHFNPLFQPKGTRLGQTLHTRGKRAAHYTCLWTGRNVLHPGTLQLRHRAMFILENPEILFQIHPNGTDSITVSTLFHRLKKLFFFSPLPGIGNTPTLASSKRTQNRNTPFTTEAFVERRTSSVFFTGGPSAVVCVCRRKCVVGKLLCDALAFVWALAQTKCSALATTHLCRLFFHVNVWLDRPWRRHSFKRRQHHEDAMQQGQKDQTNESSGLCHLGRYGSHLFCAQSCPKADKNNRKTQKVIALSYGSTIQWAFRSDRPDPVLGSFWQVCTHPMM